MKFSSGAFLCLALVATSVRAKDEEAEDYLVEEEEGATGEVEYEEFDEDYDSHEVTTSYLIPDYMDKRFPVGKPVTVLIDFSNNGEDVFNVTDIACYLHSPFDLNYYIQNFTAKAVSGVSAPGAQISLEYTFTPDIKLEPLEFWLSGLVQYTMEGSDELHSLTFVNTTVTLFDARTGIDFGSMLSSLLLLVAFGVLAYVVLNYAAAKAGGKKKKKLFTVAKEKVDDWDVDAYKPASTSRTAGRRPRKTSTRK